MPKFLRENAAIVVGAALPVVVVLFFVLATQLPKAYVAPPAHDVVLLSQNGPFGARPMRVDVRVESGYLRARVYQPDYAGNPAPYYGTVPRIYLWDHETQSVRELTLDLPQSETFANGTEAVVPELVGTRLSAAAVAPDGYVFTTTGYDNGVFGLFFDRNGPRWVLEKDGAVQRLDLPNEAPYWGVQFLGWVVE
jgi:hypothetical protein